MGSVMTNAGFNVNVRVRGLNQFTKLKNSMGRLNMSQSGLMSKMMVSSKSIDKNMRSAKNIMAGLGVSQVFYSLRNVLTETADQMTRIEKAWLNVRSLGTSSMRKGLRGEVTKIAMKYNVDIPESMKDYYTTASIIAPGIRLSEEEKRKGDVSLKNKKITSSVKTYEGLLELSKNISGDLDVTTLAKTFKFFKNFDDMKVLSLPEQLNEFKKQVPAFLKLYQGEAKEALNLYSKLAGTLTMGTKSSVIASATIASMSSYFENELIARQTKANVKKAYKTRARPIRVSGMLQASQQSLGFIKQQIVDTTSVKNIGDSYKQVHNQTKGSLVKAEIRTKDLFQLLDRVSEVAHGYMGDSVDYSRYNKSINIFKDKYRDSETSRVVMPTFVLKDFENMIGKEGFITEKMLGNISSLMLQNQNILKQVNLKKNIGDFTGDKDVLNVLKKARGAGLTDATVQTFLSTPMEYSKKNFDKFGGQGIYDFLLRKYTKFYVDALYDSGQGYEGVRTREKGQTLMANHLQAIRGANFIGIQLEIDNILDYISKYSEIKKGVKPADYTKSELYRYDTFKYFFKTQISLLISELPVFQKFVDFFVNLAEKLKKLSKQAKDLIKTGSSLALGTIGATLLIPLSAFIKDLIIPARLFSGMGMAGVASNILSVTGRMAILFGVFKMFQTIRGGDAQKIKQYFDTYKRQVLDLVSTLRKSAIRLATSKNLKKIMNGIYNTILSTFKGVNDSVGGIKKFILNTTSKLRSLFSEHSEVLDKLTAFTKRLGYAVGVAFGKATIVAIDIFITSVEALVTVFSKLTDMVVGMWTKINSLIPRSLANNNLTSDGGRGRFGEKRENIALSFGRYLKNIVGDGLVSAFKNSTTFNTMALSKMVDNLFISPVRRVFAVSFARMFSTTLIQMTSLTEGFVGLLKGSFLKYKNANLLYAIVGTVVDTVGFAFKETLNQVKYTAKGFKKSFKDVRDIYDINYRGGKKQYGALSNKFAESKVGGKVVSAGKRVSAFASKKGFRNIGFLNEVVGFDMSTGVLSQSSSEIVKDFKKLKSIRVGLLQDTISLKQLTVNKKFITDQALALSKKIQAQDGGKATASQKSALTMMGNKINDISDKMNAKKFILGERKLDMLESYKQLRRTMSQTELEIEAFTELYPSLKDKLEPLNKEMAKINKNSEIIANVDTVVDEYKEFTKAFNENLGNIELGKKYNFQSLSFDVDKYFKKAFLEYQENIVSSLDKIKLGNNIGDFSDITEDTMKVHSKKLYNIYKKNPERFPTEVSDYLNDRPVTSRVERATEKASGKSFGLFKKLAEKRWLLKTKKQFMFNGNYWTEEAATLRIKQLEDMLSPSAQGSYTKMYSEWKALFSKEHPRTKSVATTSPNWRRYNGEVTPSEKMIKSQRLLTGDVQQKLLTSGIVAPEPNFYSTRKSIYSEPFSSMHMSEGYKGKPIATPGIAYLKDVPDEISKTESVALARVKNNLTLANRELDSEKYIKKVLDASSHTMKKFNATYKEFDFKFYKMIGGFDFTKPYVTMSDSFREILEQQGKGSFRNLLTKLQLLKQGKLQKTKQYKDTYKALRTKFSGVTDMLKDIKNYSIMKNTLTDNEIKKARLLKEELFDFSLSDRVVKGRKVHGTKQSIAYRIKNIKKELKPYFEKNSFQTIDKTFINKILDEKHVNKQARDIVNVSVEQIHEIKQFVNEIIYGKSGAKNIPFKNTVKYNLGEKRVKQLYGKVASGDSSALVKKLKEYLSDSDLSTSFKEMYFTETLKETKLINKETSQKALEMLKGKRYKMFENKAKAVFDFIKTDNTFTPNAQANKILSFVDNNKDINKHVDFAGTKLISILKSNNLSYSSLFDRITEVMSVRSFDKITEGMNNSSINDVTIEKYLKKQTGTSFTNANGDSMELYSDFTKNFNSMEHVESKMGKKTFLEKVAFMLEENETLSKEQERIIRRYTYVTEGNINKDFKELNGLLSNSPMQKKLVSPKTIKKNVVENVTKILSQVTPTSAITTELKKEPQVVYKKIKHLSLFGDLKDYKSLETLRNLSKNVGQKYLRYATTSTPFEAGANWLNSSSINNVDGLRKRYGSSRVYENLTTIPNYSQPLFTKRDYTTISTPFERGTNWLDTTSINNVDRLKKRYGSSKIYKNLTTIPNYSQPLFTKTPVANKLKEEFLTLDKYNKLFNRSKETLDSLHKKILSDAMSSSYKNKKKFSLGRFNKNWDTIVAQNKPKRLFDKYNIGRNAENYDEIFKQNKPEELYKKYLKRSKTEAIKTTELKKIMQRYNPAQTPDIATSLYKIDKTTELTRMSKQTNSLAKNYIESIFKKSLVPSSLGHEKLFRNALQDDKAFNIMGNKFNKLPNMFPKGFDFSNIKYD